MARISRVEASLRHRLPVPTGPCHVQSSRLDAQIICLAVVRAWTVGNFDPPGDRGDARLLLLLLLRTCYRPHPHPHPHSSTAQLLNSTYERPREKVRPDPDHLVRAGLGRAGLGLGHSEVWVSQVCFTVVADRLEFNVVADRLDRMRAAAAETVTPWVGTRTLETHTCRRIRGRGREGRDGWGAACHCSPARRVPPHKAATHAPPARSSSRRVDGAGPTASRASAADLSRAGSAALGRAASAAALGSSGGGSASGPAVAAMPGPGPAGGGSSLHGVPLGAVHRRGVSAGLLPQVRVGGW